MTILLVVEDGVIRNVSPSSYKKSSTIQQQPSPPSTSSSPLPSSSDPNLSRDSNSTLDIILGKTTNNPDSSAKNTTVASEDIRYDVKSVLSAQVLLNRRFEDVFRPFSFHDQVKTSSDVTLFNPPRSNNDETEGSDDGESSSEHPSTSSKPTSTQQSGTPVQFVISSNLVAIENLHLFGNRFDISEKTSIYLLLPLFIRPETLDSSMGASIQHLPALPMNPSLKRGIYPAFVFNQYGMIIHSFHDAIPTSIPIMSLVHDFDLSRLFRAVDENRPCQLGLRLLRISYPPRFKRRSYFHEGSTSEFTFREEDDEEEPTPLYTSSKFDYVHLHLHPIDTISDSPSPLWLAQFKFSPFETLGFSSKSKVSAEPLHTATSTQSSSTLRRRESFSSRINKMGPFACAIDKLHGSGFDKHAFLEEPDFTYDVPMFPLPPPLPSSISNTENNTTSLPTKTIEFSGSPNQLRKRHGNVVLSCPENLEAIYTSLVTSDLSTEQASHILGGHEQQQGTPQNVQMRSKSILAPLRWVTSPILLVAEKGIRFGTSSVSTSFHYTVSFGKFCIKTFIVPLTPSPIYQSSKYLMIQVQTVVEEQEKLATSAISRCLSLCRSVFGDTVIDSASGFLRKFI